MTDPDILIKAFGRPLDEEVKEYLRTVAGREDEATLERLAQAIGQEKPALTAGKTPD